MKFTSYFSRYYSGHLSWFCLTLINSLHVIYHFLYPFPTTNSFPSFHKISFFLPPIFIPLLSPTSNRILKLFFPPVVHITWFQPLTSFLPYFPPIPFIWVSYYYIPAHEHPSRESRWKICTPIRGSPRVCRLSLGSWLWIRCRCSCHIALVFVWCPK